MTSTIGSASTSSKPNTLKSFNTSTTNPRYTTTTTTTNCNKFIPQAFNTNKCQQCFNLKESHSLEALAEFSKSNRKLCKFGYLFIAPPDLELNKTKRWQWRFFILYDDGELTYSLDDNPLTLPQGRINIAQNCDEIIELNNNNNNNKNLDQTSSIVNYPNCLRLKFKNTIIKDIYIAAGSYEEISKWRDAILFNCKKIRFIATTTKNNDTDIEDELENVDYIDSSTSSSYYSANNKRNNENLKLKMISELNTSNNNKLKKSKNFENEIEKIEAENAESNSNSIDGSVEAANNRRLSYKEDDLLRKQRLKDNLNQLLIEYKHEEEAQLKKSTRFSISNPVSSNSNSAKINNNRISLDSCYSNNNKNKSSAFSLVVQPNQQQQVTTGPNLNSAFRPVNNTEKNNKNLEHIKKVTKSPSSSSSSSEASSWSSNCSSSSSSSSSSSPPKIRQSNLISVQTNDYKKPCLISPLNNNNNNSNSPNKTELSPKNKTEIMKVNRSVLISGQNNNNLSGYIWKTRDNNSKSTTSNNDQQFERFWFSLNTNLCYLIYWNDKHEQDLGKFPVGKYELAKCCQIYAPTVTQQQQQTEFKLTLHQNTISLNLRLNNMETTLNWYEAIKYTIESMSGFCAKCKPKLVVNPMPLLSSPNQSLLVTQPVVDTVESTPAAPPTPPVHSINKDDYDKLLKENTQLNSKYKLLEQIHLEAIAEYDNQHQLMFNQIDELNLKLNKTESEQDQLNKLLFNSKQQTDLNLSQINALNEELLKYKETIEKKDKEIEFLANNNNNKSICCDDNNDNTTTNLTRANWNKEVKNLDARITDVLGKLKERELNLNPTSSTISNTNDDYRYKFEKCQSQLNEALNQLKQQTPAAAAAATTKDKDFSDDLAKVLMSKEEVITQLEKQIKDKEKQIQTLTSQLSEELTNQQVMNKYQFETSELNNELMSLNQRQTNELDSIRDKLNSTTSQMQSMQSQMDQIKEEKEQIEIEFKNLNEFTRNEIETLQEEVKTLEYKLVHSQRQAQEYQSILEDLDAINTNSLNYLQKFEIITDNFNSNNNNNNDHTLQNKLKKNQIQVNNLMQSILTKQKTDLNDLNERYVSIQNELNELKDENLELNNHIYSIDVFMREKDAQCDQFQKENNNLLQKLYLFENLNQLDFEFNYNDNDDDDELKMSQNYKLFIYKLKHLLETKTTNLNDFLRLIINMCTQLIILFKLDSTSDDFNLDEMMIRTKLNEKNILQFLNELFSSSQQTTQSESTLNLINDLNHFNKTFKSKSIDASGSATIRGATINKNQDFKSLKKSIVQLVKFINSQDLMQFNCQIHSYMAEQLVHKACLNGNLKFACDFLKKKYLLNTSDSNSNLNSNNTNNNKDESSSSSSSIQQNEQDDKIFKLASELLLSDENTLRKLSTQVLNEAQHLNQLDWVLNTLRKLRWKHLNLKSKDKLDLVLNNLNDFNDNEDDEEEYYEDDDDDDNDDEECFKSLLDSNNLIQIIKDVFNEHKLQLSEQLSQVQKLMFIVPDDDLLTNLQNENQLLQQEIHNLKQNTNKMILDKKSSPTNTITTTNWLNTTSTGGPTLRKFSTSNSFTSKLSPS